MLGYEISKLGAYAGEHNENQRVDQADAGYDANFGARGKAER
jgi:hypothetical protein